ncbi:MAG: N-formylglutamate amidohydrolase [Gammaproteobacteria bacterium]|nr:N-formylglutamate amidohydrolase [Gammaproteobacteria bacterium]
MLSTKRFDANKNYPLIGPEDPPPVEVLNPESDSKVLLVCDHASRSFPAAMNKLGLDDLALDRHIAWDIGAGAVTRLLAARFDATAVLAGYSRLIVDYNRKLDDPTAFPEISDGIMVPGNQGLSKEARIARVISFYEPYHEAISAEIEAALSSGVYPAIVSIHSFTPMFAGRARHWKIGVLWDKDPRIPTPLIGGMRKRVGDDCVGDNEPYSGRDPHDFTVDNHAETRGLPNVSIEIRQDLIDSDEGVTEWAGHLGDVLAPILADPDLYQILEME